VAVVLRNGHKTQAHSPARTVATTILSGLITSRTLQGKIMSEEKKAEFYNLVDKHYRENHDRLVKAYTRFIQHKERAEDVIQEAYLRALSFWEAYDPERPFDKWFNSIIASALRDNKRTETMHGMVDIKEAYDIPIKAAAIPAVILRQVTDRINTKGEQEAAILRLTLFDHYRPGEISQLVRLSSGAIRQIVHRFREEIKRDYKWSL
jgi:RNA polymerase sigma factor (sigma-70 family)